MVQTSSQKQGTDTKTKTAKFELCILFFGSPGSGKSCYSKYVSKDYGFPLVAASKLIKESGTLLSPGEFADNQTMIELLNCELDNLDITGYSLPNVVILEGFPRNLEQAKYFIESICYEFNFILSINLVCSKEEIIKRLASRSVEQDRSDDGPEIVLTRLNQFDSITKTAIDYLNRILSCQFPGCYKQIEISSEYHKEIVYWEISNEIDKIITSFV